MLFLLPNLLDPSEDALLVLPGGVSKAVASLDGLIAESPGMGRAFLRRFPCKKKPEQIPIALLNRNNCGKDHIHFLLEPLVKEERWGFLSDAGLPCIADPGAQLVREARRLNIPIEALPGPSSLFLSLMLSGLSGQRFSFRGYPSKESEKRRKEFKHWEAESKKEKSTQIFIEAPHRNCYAWKDCLDVLQKETLMSVSAKLGSPSQFVATYPVQAWIKKEPPPLHKVPAVFLFQAL